MTCITLKVSLDFFSDTLLLCLLIFLSLSSSTGPLNVVHQVSLLGPSVLFCLGNLICFHGFILLSHLYANHSLISFIPVSSFMSHRYFKLETIAVFLLSSSTFFLPPPHLPWSSVWSDYLALLQNIWPFHLLCHFFIISCLCHLFYHLSPFLLFPRLFHIANWVVILEFCCLLFIWCAGPLTVYSQVASFLCCISLSPEATVIHGSFPFVFLSPWLPFLSLSCVKPCSSGVRKC